MSDEDDLFSSVEDDDEGEEQEAIQPSTINAVGSGALVPGIEDEITPLTENEPELPPPVMQEVEDQSTAVLPPDPLIPLHPSHEDGLFPLREGGTDIERALASEDHVYVRNPSDEFLGEPSENTREASSPTGLKRKADSDNVGTPSKKSKVPQETVEEEDDDDGSYCTICFDSWTNSGEHRIASLRCGHFFGFACIDKWLKSGKACPNCNEKACKKDIRSHYVAKLKAIDTSEKERFKSDLEKLQGEHRALELDYVALKLQSKMQLEEISRLQGEVSRLFKGAEGGSLLSGVESSHTQAPPAKTSSTSGNNLKWIFKKRIELVKESTLRSGKFGCRIMSYDFNQAMLVISQPSYTQLAPGYGVRRVNMLDISSNTHSFVRLHKEQIRDVEFNPSNHDQLLSVSQDKSIKLTNISSCSDIQRYNCEAEVWSCAWNADDPFEFFVGTKRSQILLFDVRQSAEAGYKNQLEFPIIERRPIINMSYVESSPRSPSFKCGGLLVQTLGSLWFFRRDAPESYKPFKLPIEGLFWSLRFEAASRLLYVTMKPSPHARHVVANLTEVSLSENALAVSADVIMDHSRGGTFTEKSFLRSTLYSKDESAFVAFTRGSSHSDHKIIVQEVGSDRIVQEIVVRKPIIDICFCPVNEHLYLVLLSETEIFVYKLTDIL